MWKKIRWKPDEILKRNCLENYCFLRAKSFQNVQEGVKTPVILFIECNFQRNSNSEVRLQHLISTAKINVFDLLRQKKFFFERQHKLIFTILWTRSTAALQYFPSDIKQIIFGFWTENFR